MGKKPAGEAPTFEKSLGELETIVKQMESSELPLEKSIELFERGVTLSNECRKQLVNAETRVEILMKRGAEVEPAGFNPEEE